MNPQQLPIKRPCTQDWSSMEGSDKRRYCPACDQTVHDLSAMTRAEADALLGRRRAGQRLCVRYTVGEQGEIRFQPQPLLPAALLVRTRQVALRATLAAAAITAAVELPACTPAGPASGALAARLASEEAVAALAARGTCEISLEPLLPLSLTLHAAACPPAPPPREEARLGQAPELVEPPPLPAETPPPPRQVEPIPAPASTDGAPERPRPTAPARVARKAAAKKPVPMPLIERHFMGDIAE
jgi:hypothetical protein